MNVHPQVEELLPGYAIGAIDEEEQALVQRHVRDCQACAEALGRHLEVAAALALAADEVTPPVGLRQRIMAAATAEPRVAPVVAVPIPAIPRPNWREWLAPRRASALRPQGLAMAAAAMVLLGVVGWNVSLQQRLTTTESQLAANRVLHGELKNTSGVSVGGISYLSRDNLALVSFHGLSRPAGKVYELWVIDATGKAEPIDTFLPEQDGTKLIVVPRRLGPSDLLAVTEEPPGGSRIPTSAPIYSGQI